MRLRVDTKYEFVSVLSFGSCKFGQVLEPWEGGRVTAHADIATARAIGFALQVTHWWSRVGSETRARVHND